MKNLTVFMLLALLIACTESDNKMKNKKLAHQIMDNEYFVFTRQKAEEIMETGFNAGDGYREVWIRDYTTFMELAAAVHPASELKENLLIFLRMQADDGNILDGVTPLGDNPLGVGYDYYFTEREPNYAGHKNTVETDQETSLVQGVFRYIRATGDEAILKEDVFGKTVLERLEWAMQYLMDYKYDQQYGLLFGATTADWGDVQPGHVWGVKWDENTYPAIDIYDNAMFIIALDNLMEMAPETKTRWEPIRNHIFENTRKHLWDVENQKFIPHIYLERGSPFPEDFDENQIYYFGGTAVAIEAGLLSHDEVKHSIDEMARRVQLAGAASIGLTLYPPYPEGFFINPSMSPEYSYQNGGDWTWFGGRMIQQLINYGYLGEAYEHIQPMVKRVKENDGFFEWYTINNEPRGSGTFRGSAGVLYKAIMMFEEFAAENYDPL